MAHTTLYWSSRVAGPSQRPRVYEVHWASITGSWTCVSSGKCAVVSMGAIAAACPILERNGPCISGPELQAASPVLTWWAKRTQLAFLEGVRRSIRSRICCSTTLASETGRMLKSSKRCWRKGETLSTYALVHSHGQQVPRCAAVHCGRTAPQVCLLQVFQLLLP